MYANNTPHTSIGPASPGARIDYRNITVSQAVDLFLRSVEVNRPKSVKDHRTVLKGAQHRVIGKAAAGPALAESRLAKLPIRRTTAADFRDWFLDRHPHSLAAATRKRGMSSMRSFLNFVVVSGWGDGSLLTACESFSRIQPCHEWLRPEQVKALSALVREPEFDPYEQFDYETYLATGVRAMERCELRLDDLDPFDRVLTIRRGKGRNDGKWRQIPVDDLFMDRWEDHARRYNIAPGGYMFFRRLPKQVAGQPRGTFVYEEDRRLPASPQSSRRMLRRLTDLARERLADEELRPAFYITPKVLRRTYACVQVIKSELNEDGQGGALGMRSLQEAMGHESLETTSLYLADVAAYLRRHRRFVGTLRAVDDILERVREQDASSGGGAAAGGRP
ncbi:MAG TPA: tyrosine-type recombinase/integrase [Capillimicrobium sp.]|nr:tyrosine-type recombinase/integrase [Capillimicrobium sp.]